MIAREDPRDARLTDYLDGVLDAAGRAEIEADADLLAALAEARGAQALLGTLPQRAPPRDFLRKVQRRVRRRSGGRYFHPVAAPAGYRLSIEVFAVIAVAVMAASYFFIQAAPSPPGPLVEEPVVESPVAPALD